MTFDSINHWRLITKLFVIANVLVWWQLMGWAPNSLVYAVGHSHAAGAIPFYAFSVGLVVLVFELVMTDHHNRARRCWWGKPFVPIAYMLLGGAYLVFAFMCSLVPGAEVLAINATIQGLAAGWVAVLEKRNL